MDDMDRLAHVTDRFTEHFRSIGAEPVVLTRLEWAGVENQANLRVSLGIHRPTPDDPRCRFCPELIVAQTTQLDDRDFVAYLDALQFAVDHESTLAMDHDDATLTTDEVLSDRAPGSLRLLTQVQMAWMDKASER